MLAYCINDISEIVNNNLFKYHMQINHYSDTLFERNTLLF